MKSEIFILLYCCICISCNGQQKPLGMEYLKLEKIIEMPEVSGRIDHMAINLKDKVLYVAALGNNTVEVIDLAKGAPVKSIKGIKEPQGIIYIPGTNEIAVASGGNGDCIFFNATTYEQVAVIHLAGDADNIRYDAAEQKMYVGYGDGGIAMIDPETHKQTGDVKLPAHPESFQLDKKNNKLYVNLPDDHSIAVIDLKSFTVVDTWKTGKYNANFPMAIDTANNLVFVGYRHPALLVSYDNKSGKEISTNELVGDADDIFYDVDKQQIIASGGDGYINIFKRESTNSYKKIADIPSRSGARTSLLIPSLQLFVVAERAGSDSRAAIVLLRMKN